ncbi:MAG: alpha/beta hydrolase [Burkholderiaceae bacterium]
MTNKGLKETIKVNAVTGAGSPRCLRAGALDVEAGTLLKGINMLGMGAPAHDTLDKHRRLWQALARVLGRGQPVAQVQNLRIPGPEEAIDIRIYRPSQGREPLPAFIWFHGGAFLIGGLTTADSICRHVAQASGAIVVSVRYRLAPEHDLYASRTDCLAAVQWLADNGQKLGIDTTRLAVGGDSAGGNLAAAVSQRCAELGGPALRLQVLVYPATNLRDEYPSVQQNGQGYLLTLEVIEGIKNLLDERHPDVDDPWLSPALNPRLDQVPPALVLTAGYDPVRDDGIAYVELLREAGVPVELLHYPGQFHGFVNFNGVMRTARDALDRIGGALRHAFASAEPAPHTAPNRTIEVTSHTKLPQTRLPAPPARALLISSLMWAERLESLRADAMRRMVPGSRLLSALATSPVINPATAWRALLGNHYATIEARQTYQRSQR